MLPNISQCPIQAPPQRTIQLKLQTVLRLRNCSQRMKIKECACPCVCVCVCVCVCIKEQYTLLDSNLPLVESMNQDKFILSFYWEVRSVNIRSEA